MTTTTVTLHGFMAEKYGKEVEVAGNTIKQVMNGLKFRLGNEFRQDIIDNDWHVVTGTGEKEEEALSESDLPNKLTSRTLHLIPVIQAAKKFVQIIIGVVLIAISIYFPGPWSPYLMQAGIGMIISGVVNLIFAPKPPGGGQGDDSSGSYVFNGAINITTQGGVKPIIFGKVDRCGSVIISSDFSTDIIAQNDDQGLPSTDTSTQMIDTPIYYDPP